MPEQEKEKTPEELQKWTEEFVQREWYKEFLEVYPLSKYPSLLEVSVWIDIRVNGYIDKYKIIENKHEFFKELRYDFLNLYYNDMNNDVNRTFTILNKKYGNIVNDDLNYLASYAEWFFNNRIMNIEIDEKHNLK